MAKIQVLVVCNHTSARSQMAEAWLRHLCGKYFNVQSAGIEPGKLNSFAVKVMREVGIDISDKIPQGVIDLYNRGERFSYVIAVCDKEAAEKCPIFPGVTERLHWSFPDPSKVTGSEEEKLAKIRPIRDAIKEKVENWCASVCGK